MTQLSAVVQGLLKPLMKLVMVHQLHVEVKVTAVVADVVDGVVVAVECGADGTEFGGGIACCWGSRRSSCC